MLDRFHELAQLLKTFLENDGRKPAVVAVFAVDRLPDQDLSRKVFERLDKLSKNTTFSYRIDFAIDAKLPLAGTT
jgi:hypothetical protein